MLVSMSFAETNGIPSELALLYDFVNTLDERRYMEKGALHGGGDEIATPPLLAKWMRARGLLGSRARIKAAEHRAALDLRQALREFLRNPPDQRPRAEAASRRLTAASRAFPLALAVSDTGSVELVCMSGSNARPGASANAGPRWKGSARSAQDLRFRRVPLDLLRSFQARKPALVLVRPLRQPAENADLPRPAPSRRLAIMIGLTGLPLDPCPQLASASPS
jgi:hypothetical protein